MTPLLTLSHLPSPPGSAGRAATRGCSWRGVGGGLWPLSGAAEHAGARGGGRGQGPAAAAAATLLPGGSKSRQPGGGRVEEERGGGGPGSATPPPVYLDAVGGGCATGLESAATAPRRRRRRSCASRGRRARRAQDVLSHAAPAAQLTLLRDPQHFLPRRSLTLTAPCEHPVCGSPRPRPTPSTPRAPPAGGPSAPGIATSGWLRPRGCWQQHTWGGLAVYPCATGSTRLSGCKRKSFSVVRAPADMPTWNNFHSLTTTLGYLNRNRESSDPSVTHKD